ncbi:hypothetical protein D3C71_1049220 [compost metagenome]
MDDTLLCGEVVGNAVTLVEDFAGGAIGDGGDGTFAGTAADRFYTAMIDRHAGLPIKRAGRTPVSAPIPPAGDRKQPDFSPSMSCLSPGRQLVSAPLSNSV